MEIQEDSWFTRQEEIFKLVEACNTDEKLSILAKLESKDTEPNEAINTEGTHLEKESDDTKKHAKKEDHTASTSAVNLAGMKCRPTSRRCGLCENCLLADCGKCRFCKDKPRFGGPGKLKQACSKKKCLQLAKPKTGSPSKEDRAQSPSKEEEEKAESPSKDNRPVPSKIQKSARTSIKYVIGFANLNLQFLTHY
ncbi:lysine-specific demethylase 2B-like isoform X2 [Dysidea avara]|uniref:lysine-specific demethylase 2B-like isoform X2 n=1 Tax=Dysidea avara TaxID=196820 RepID=UPI0033237674